MASLIVSSRKRDPKTQGVQKYDNSASWNVVGGMAPNGVCATRWQRRLEPDLAQLSPLAAFLATAGDGINVSGRMPHPRRECNVQCYNGKTNSDYVDAKTSAMWGFFAKRPVKVDWLFDIIEPHETDEEYLNRQAERILAAGTVRVLFGGREWTP